MNTKRRRKLIDKLERRLEDLYSQEEPMWAIDQARYEIEMFKKHDPDKTPYRYYKPTYINHCADVALKAYTCAVREMCKADLSGMAHSIVTDILVRLLRDEQLSPIDNREEDWVLDEEFTEAIDDGNYWFHHRRRHRLSKKVNKITNEVEYSDLDTVHIRYADDCDNRYNWNNGFIASEIRKLCPITFPYTPTDIYVDAEEKLTDSKNGDYDTLAILSYHEKGGPDIAVYQYYKEDNDTFVQIDIDEYKERCKMHYDRKEEENAYKKENV